MGDNGIYIENCKYVSYGFFGNLDDCKAALNYMGKEKLYGFEAWGEDLVAQKCMDMHGVDKVPGYDDISTDAACAAWRPEGQKKNFKWRPDCVITMTPSIHPFKKPKEHFDCLKATQGL